MQKKVLNRKKTTIVLWVQLQWGIDRSKLPTTSLEDRSVLDKTTTEENEECFVSRIISHLF